MNVRPSIEVLLRCTRDREDLKAILLLFLFSKLTLFVFGIRRLKNPNKKCNNVITLIIHSVHNVAFGFIFFFFTFFRSENNRNSARTCNRET